LHRTGIRYDRARSAEVRSDGATRGEGGAGIQGHQSARAQIASTGRLASDIFMLGRDFGGPVSENRRRCRAGRKSERGGHRAFHGFSGSSGGPEFSTGRLSEGPARAQELLTNQDSESKIRSIVCGLIVQCTAAKRVGRTKRASKSAKTAIAACLRWCTRAYAFLVDRQVFMNALRSAPFLPDACFAQSRILSCCGW